MDNQDTNAGVRYERKDIRLGCLLAAMVVAMCVVATVLFVVWQFFWWQAGGEAAKSKSPYSQSPGLLPQLPPEPRLEQLDRLAGEEGSNVDKRLAAQEKTLNSSGPTDEKGFVHIPIQQVIKAIAGKLPVRPQSPGPAADNGLMDSGESNSGRMFRGEQP